MDCRYHQLEAEAVKTERTTDFGFTKVTASAPFRVNNAKYQFFAAEHTPPKNIVSLLVQLPMAVRVLMLLMISFLLCWLLAKSFTNPLIAIQKASKKIGEGKMQTKDYNEMRKLGLNPDEIRIKLDQIMEWNDK